MSSGEEVNLTKHTSFVRKKNEYLQFIFKVAQTCAERRGDRKGKVVKYCLESFNLFEIFLSIIK